MTIRRTIHRGACGWLVALIVGVEVWGGTASRASAITGGTDATEAYAFMGSLQRPDSPRQDSEHVCGVSLIAPTWAVTAAHCVRSPAQTVDGGPTTGHPKGWKVRFGSTALDAGGKLVDVAQFVQYANEYAWWQPGATELGDLALLRLATAVDLTPIPIAASRPAADAAIRTMGWGLSREGDGITPTEYATHLQTLDMTAKASCGVSPLRDQYCTVVADGRSVQNMDSGGPAVVRDGDRWSLAGIVNGGNIEEDIFVDVTLHKDWIDGFVSGRTPIPADSPFPSSALNGTVKINNGCSGALIRAPKGAATDRAVVLTNGHCVSPRPAPGETIGSHAPAPTAFTPVMISDDAGNVVQRSRVARVLGATMTGTDIAVLELDATYEEIGAHGVNALMLAPSGPRPGDAIQVLSALSQQDWTCTVGAVVPELREGGYTMKDSIRYLLGSGCDGEAAGLSHGDSGSPIVNSDTREIVGIHNTGNDDGEECTDDNPCEITADGTVLTTRGAKYGQQTADLISCFDGGRTFSLTAPGCRLASIPAGSEQGPESVPTDTAAGANATILADTGTDRVPAAVIAAGLVVLGGAASAFTFQQRRRRAGLPSR